MFENITVLNQYNINVTSGDYDLEMATDKIFADAVNTCVSCLIDEWEVEQGTFIEYYMKNHNISKLFLRVVQAPAINDILVTVVDSNKNPGIFMLDYLNDWIDAIKEWE